MVQIPIVWSQFPAHPRFSKFIHVSTCPCASTVTGGGRCMLVKCCGGCVSSWRCSSPSDLGPPVAQTPGMYPPGRMLPAGGLKCHTTGCHVLRQPVKVTNCQFQQHHQSKLWQAVCYGNTLGWLCVFQIVLCQNGAVM